MSTQSNPHSFPAGKQSTNPARYRLGLLGFTLVLASAILSVIILLTKNSARAQGLTIYVSASGDCGGVSPCYSTIQSGVDAADNGDTVKVAQGTYTGPAFAVVYISKAITLTGGYTTTDWINSYPITRPTVIDAEVFLHHHSDRERYMPPAASTGWSWLDKLMAWIVP